MKKALYTLLLVSISTFLKAQDGVFLTYEDFQNNKMVSADGNSMTYDYGKNGKAILKHAGEKKVYKLTDIWGFREGDKTYRATHSDEKDPLAVVLMIGNYVYYAFDVPVYHAGTASGGMGYGNGARAHYYISKDLNSPVYFFTAHRETLDELISKHPEFAALKPFLTKAKKDSRSEYIVQDCIKKSPEYKATKQLSPQE
jgi:hypothetical protein